MNYMNQEINTTDINKVPGIPKPGSKQPQGTDELSWRKGKSSSRVLMVHFCALENQKVGLSGQGPGLGVSGFGVCPLKP